MTDSDVSRSWVDLGPVEGPAEDPRSRWTVDHGGGSYAVFVLPAAVRVTDALCPHKQGRLVEGVMRGDLLVCPSHWYTFDLADGRCATTPDLTLGTYDVEVLDGHVHALLPDRVVRRSWSELLRAHAAGPPPG